MRSVNDDSSAEQIQAMPEDGCQALLKACTLYSMNDMLYQKGFISADKKQKVAQEIWKKYHI